MAGEVIWEIRAYDIGGNPQTVNYSGYDPGRGSTPTERVYYATGSQLQFNLNGVDQFDFSLYLDDPMALKIKRLNTVIKVTRIVNDPVTGKTVFPSQPTFCGVVASTIKNGSDNKMSVTCYNPLWRLQSRFHIDNHFLEINPDTGVEYTQSELIWKLIELVNGAFGGSSYTGIDMGTFEWGLPGEPQVAPYFVQKGSNTWSHIFDVIMVRAASADLFPDYHHTDGDPTMMLLNTMQRRGLDKSAGMKFNYYTDPATLVPNLDDLSEEETPMPGNNDGGFCNFLWVVGQGGPNSGKISEAENASSTSGSDGYGEIGIYMSRVDRDIKRLAGAFGGGINKIAEAEFAQRKIPAKIYTANLTPAAPIYYGYDYVLGDVVALNANKGALVVDNVKQRIYQVTLNMSDNQVESSSLSLSHDFYGNVSGFTGG